MAPHLRFASLSTLALVAGGCRDTVPPGGTTVRDSAGVTIVESASPRWRDSDAWQVDPTPALTIGVEDGDEPYQFFRVWSARRLPTGDIVVGNSGSSELRFFDSTGTYMRRAGGRGGGPGEFHEFASMDIWTTPPDTVLVTDGPQGRINRFLPDGSFAGMVQFERTEVAADPALRGVFADGTLFGIAIRGSGSLGGYAPGSIIPAPTFRYLRYDADGSNPRVIAEALNRPRYVQDFEGIGTYPFIPLTIGSFAAPVGAGLALVRNGAAALEIYDREGDLVRIARWQPDPVRTDAIWNRYREAVLETIQDEDRPRRYRRLYETDLPVPDYAPATEALLTDPGGFLWVRRFRFAWDTLRVWDVIDPDGGWLGTVSTPARVTVFEIGDDYIVGRHVDALRIERIQVYGLKRTT